jgi:hypothetical protein
MNALSVVLIMLFCLLVLLYMIRDESEFEDDPPEPKLDTHCGKIVYQTLFVHVLRLACEQSRVRRIPLPKEITKEHIRRGFKKLRNLGVEPEYFDFALEMLIKRGFITECGKNPDGKRLFVINKNNLMSELERWGLFTRRYSSFYDQHIITSGLE